jgi:hypothetical protein
MWEVLKMLRCAVEFHLEPYVQLSSNISGAIAIWLELNSLAVNDTHPISYQSSMTRPQADIGALFHEPQRITFNCGPFLLKDDITRAVCWDIPPPD